MFSSIDSEYIYFRVAQKTSGSKTPWQKAKDSLSDVEFEKIFFEKVCSSPDPVIVKKTFAQIFGNYITQHFLWIYIIFHILTQPKNHRKNIL